MAVWFSVRAAALAFSNRLVPRVRPAFDLVHCWPHVLSIPSSPFATSRPPSLLAQLTCSVSGKPFSMMSRCFTVTSCVSPCCWNSAAASSAHRRSALQHSDSCSSNAPTITPKVPKRPTQRQHGCVQQLARVFQQPIRVCFQQSTRVSPAPRPQPPCSLAHPLASHQLRLPLTHSPRVELEGVHVAGWRHRPHQRVREAAAARAALQHHAACGGRARSVAVNRQHRAHAAVRGLGLQGCFSGPAIFVRTGCAPCRQCLAVSPDMPCDIPPTIPAPCRRPAPPRLAPRRTHLAAGPAASPPC